VSGLFVAIVGPSGAGKDSLIRAVALRFADNPAFLAVKRVVTRDADAHEDHHTLDRDGFAAAAENGRFALTWEAHGLSYGVPAEVDDALAAGKIVVCNLSRGAVPLARQRWANLLTVLVTARPETLARRLAARGREKIEDQIGRISRAAHAAIDVDAVIENEGELADAADRLFAVLRERARLPA